MPHSLTNTPEFIHGHYQKFVRVLSPSFLLVVLHLNGDLQVEGAQGARRVVLFGELDDLAKVEQQQGARGRHILNAWIGSYAYHI